MNGYLLDTNTLSMFFNGRATAFFDEWIDARQREDAIFISVMSLQELEKGAAKLGNKKNGSPRKAELIVGWIRALFVEYENRLLPVTANIALRAGQMEGLALAHGHSPGIADVLIAATADVHDLVVVTENLRHFEALSVPCEPPALK